MKTMVHIRRISCAEPGAIAAIDEIRRRLSLNGDVISPSGARKGDADHFSGRAGGAVALGQPLDASVWRREDEIAAAWPMPMPRNWMQLVNSAETEAEVKALRRAVNRGTPFGSEVWQERIARRLGLQYTLRPRGRPKKADAAAMK